MKVKTITIAILAMMLLVSCDESGQSPEAPESLTPTIGQGSYSQEYTVDTYTTITLDNIQHPHPDGQGLLPLLVWK